MKEHPSQDSSTERVVDVINPSGKGNFVLVCEHASCFIPTVLANLGLSGDVLRSHIAWDPGALAVAQVMSAQLDAALVLPRFSRLVYDCNRPPEAQSAMAAESEIYEIPGNTGLSAEARQARVTRFYEPFREVLTATIRSRMAGGRYPALVTVHSFTPIYKGVSREVDIGILHDSDTRLADGLLGELSAADGLRVKRNSPYGPQDGVTYTLATHAIPLRLPNVMIEIRNDLIADTASQNAMAARLSAHLIAAQAALTGG